MHIAELIDFAFSDNLSGENSKLSARSGSNGSQLLEFMDDNDEQVHPKDVVAHIKSMEGSAPVKNKKVDFSFGLSCKRYL